jgi:hypothetical protein
MADDHVNHLRIIRDSIGEIHASADQAEHLAITIKDHLLPELADSPALQSIGVLLGLAADLADRINLHAEDISRAELRLRA